MKSKLILSFLFLLLTMTNIFGNKISLKESQILKDVDESVYKTVRLMLFHSVSPSSINKDDMETLISAFSSDQKISKSERAILNQLQGENATFAILSPFSSTYLLINKTIEPSATVSLSFFWDRMSPTRSERDKIANYLYLHLPGRFFEYYYYNGKNDAQMTSILKEYIDYLSINSDKESWTLLRSELKRIYTQINIGNKGKEDEFKKLVASCYKESRDKYELPKLNLALAQ